MPGECVAHLVRNFAVLVAAKWQLRPVWLLWAAWPLGPYGLCAQMLFFCGTSKLSTHFNELKVPFFADQRPLG